MRLQMKLTNRVAANGQTNVQMFRTCLYHVAVAGSCGDQGVLAVAMDVATTWLGWESAQLRVGNRATNDQKDQENQKQINQRRAIQLGKSARAATQQSVGLEPGGK